MNINHQPFTRLDSRYLLRTLLTLTVMLLLVAIWIALFLWGLLMTENILTPLSPVIFPFFGGWQINLGTFFQVGIGAFAPAFILLLVSQLLFFYRMPRTRRRVVVPLEFVLTTFLFIVSHMVLFYLLNFSIGQYRGLLPSVNLGLTLVMLGMFFWLQWSGFVECYLRKHMKKTLAFIALDTVLH